MIVGEATVSGWRIDTKTYNIWLSAATVNISSCASLGLNESEGEVCVGTKDGCVGDQGGPLAASDPQQNGAMSLVGVARLGYL